MFSKDNRYIINQFQQQVFNKQLPSTSQKIKFNTKRQKILNVNQTKLQLQLLKQQIYQKCKIQQLKYLDLLEMEKNRFKLYNQEKQKNKQIYWNDYIKKKYQPQQPYKSTKIRDSIDQISSNLILPPTKPKNKFQFSLQPSQQKLKQKQKQDQWVNKVVAARKILQQKFGRYYEDQLNQNKSDQQQIYSNSSYYGRTSSRKSSNKEKTQQINRKIQNKSLDRNNKNQDKNRISYMTQRAQQFQKLKPIQNQAIRSKFNQALKRMARQREKLSQRQSDRSSFYESNNMF